MSRAPHTDDCIKAGHCLYPQPIYSGRHVRQYEFLPENPTGYACGPILDLFLAMKAESHRSRPQDVYAFTELDMAADRWLWGLSPPPYSSQDAFDRWYDKQRAEMELRKLQLKMLDI